MRKIGKELFTFQKLMKMWLWGYSITNFTTVLLLFLTTTKKSWLKVVGGKSFA
jgi:hypothetical protein